MTISIEISHRKLTIRITQYRFSVLVDSSCCGVNFRKAWKYIITVVI